MTNPTADLYRMILPDHECPHGVRAKRLLDEAGFAYDEHILATRDAVEAFKMKHHVATTPQFFIDDQRIGGSEEVEAFLEQRAA